ncbi:condensation domain-containing protein, partial [Rhodococcus erythropolis]|uniref:condensation domain-containing protein n=1 Tax=Rhodococcus erythropolis TaxID=1833 RepID=UPI00294A0C5C
IITQVLGLTEPVGVDDDFFALGGDSILSIQVAARAREAGVVFSTRQVFEARTVGELAQVATVSVAGPVLEELAGGGVGWAPLTPVGYSLLARFGDWSRFHQSVSVWLPVGVEAGVVAQVVGAVLDRHEVLRSRLLERDGRVGLSIAGSGAVSAEQVIERVAVTGAISAQVMAASQAAAVGSLDPAAGVMVRCVWFDPGPGAVGRLLIVAHHLVIDGVSWRIVLADLAAAAEAVAEGRSPVGVLAPVGTSMRRWAHALVEAAQRPDVVEQVGLWREIVAGPDPVLGARRFDPARDRQSSARRVTVQVPATVTAALLTAVPEKFRTGVEDGLLAALAIAVTRWRAAGGVDCASTLVQMEGHGRDEELIAGADLSRTVGWFTSVFPVRVDLSGIDLDDAAAGGPAAGVVIKTVKETMRALPGKGIGFGLLRHLYPQAAAEFTDLGSGQIGFNYLGRTDLYSSSVDGTVGAWTPVLDSPLGDVLDDSVDDAVSSVEDLSLATAIDVNAIVVPGDEGAVLSATFTYVSGDVVDGERVTELAEQWVAALTAIAEHARQPDAGGLTPSDVPSVTVTQSDLDRFGASVGGARQVVAVWPLTDLQQGLLFHAEMARSTVDVYNVQTVIELAGDLDQARLRGAVQSMLERYENLRVGFARTAAGVPVQVVPAQATVPWTVHHRPANVVDDPGIGEWAQRVLDRELSTSFEVTAPPLLRAALLVTGPETCTLALTWHHLLLDGWSMPLLMRQILTAYTDPTPALPAVPYRRFVDWHARQDHAAALSAWTDYLHGLTAPTMLAPPRPTEEIPSRPSVEQRILDAEVTRALATTAATAQVTSATLLQVCWSIVLGAVTGSTDVVFGTTVSGRPPTISGIETIPGLFINTVPVRVELGAGRTVLEVCAQLHRAHSVLLDHQHLGLEHLHRHLGFSPLFDTLMVVETYPVDRRGLTDLAAGLGSLTVTDVHGRDGTHYPLTLVVTPGEQITFDFSYATDLFDHSTVAALAARFVSVLDQ